MAVATSVISRLISAIHVNSPPPKPDSLLVFVCKLACSRSNDLALNGFILGDEPITLYRLELEKLQCILHFPEEVAFQLSATEYQLFYSIEPIDYVRYVSCDLTSVPVSENSSPVRDLVKRISEISSWITHVIISMRSHEDRKSMVTSIMRIIDISWNIGNFNAAIELLMGLKSDKLRPFWLSLKPEDKKRYHKFCEILLPNNDESLSTAYLDALQRALRMPQCRLVPFFGVFLKDIYAIVKDVPNIVVINSEDQSSKLNTLHDDEAKKSSSESTSEVGASSLLDADKIALVGVVLSNLELFYRHKRKLNDYMERTSKAAVPGKVIQTIRGFEPIQPIGGAFNVTLIPLDTSRFDLDVIQRLQHGTTVIHYEFETGRSAMCQLKLDPSCSVLSWNRSAFTSSKQHKERDLHAQLSAMSSSNPQLMVPAESRTQTPYPRPPGAAYSTLEDGFLRIAHIKSIEPVDLYDVDSDGIYRRYSSDQVSVPTICWSINFGCHLSDNEILHFLALECTAQCWISGLTDLIDQYVEAQKFVDRRVMWLKKLYLQLLNDSEHKSGSATDGAPEQEAPKPYHALEAFGGRTNKWKDSFTKSDSAKNRFKQITQAVARKMRSGRDAGGSHSRSPKLQSSFKIRYSSARNIMFTKKTIEDSSSSNLTEIPSKLEVNNLHTRSLSSFSSKSGSPKVDKLAKVKVHDSAGCSKQISARESVALSKVEREYQEKPLGFSQFFELYKLFIYRMRKDLRVLFDESVKQFQLSDSSAEKEQSSALPAKQFECSVSEPSDFLPNDALTRNSGCIVELSDEQQKAFVVMVSSSINSSSSMDPLKTLHLTPSMLKQFFQTHQMESITEEYAAALIQVHEPDANNRTIPQLSFEGFVRLLTDPTNYAFVPESTQPDVENLKYPLSYYYICSSHNTYLTGHQLKGESSTEMYRQVLLTGCRCVELDCWDGDDGLPQIFHGHTFTTKISFQKVLNVIKKSAFTRSTLPLILSIENHCSLQQQARMAKMFKSYFGDSLVTNYLFETDYSDSPKLPSPLQLANKIIIKHKKLVAHPSAGLQVECNRSDFDVSSSTESSNKVLFDCSNGTYGTDDDDLDEFDDEMDDDDDRTDSEGLKLSDKMIKVGDPDSSNSDNEESQKPMSTQASKSTDRSVNLLMDDETKEVESVRRRAGHKGGTGTPIAPELSNLVIYAQAVKFKGFSKKSIVAQSSLLPVSRSRATTSSSSNSSSSLLLATPPRRNRSTGLFSNEVKAKGIEEIRSQWALSRPNSGAACYQVTSLNEPSTRKLLRKHPLKCIAYAREQVVRTYPGGMRIDSSNFNPIQYWAFGLQMVALNFQTSDLAMAINGALFEQNGNCGYLLKPRVLWDENHPYFGRFNPCSKDLTALSALIFTITIISGQHLSTTVHTASPMVELELIGVNADCAKERTKTVSRNSVNPTWNQSFTFRIVFVELAFLRITVTDSTNGRCMAQRVLPVRCIRAGYRHVPLRTASNNPLEQAVLFIRSRFEQEEHIYVHDEDAMIHRNIEQKLTPQILKLSGDAVIRPIPVLKRPLYVLRLSGFYADDTPVIVRAQAHSTVSDVLRMALATAGKSADSADDYVMVEINASHQFRWDNEQQQQQQQQQQHGFRMMQLSELVLNSVACWNGSPRRFVVRKRGSDLGSPAWKASIIKGSSVPSSPMVQSSNVASCMSNELASEANSTKRVWLSKSDTGTISGTFLISVHNISKQHPYAIVRMSKTSTAAQVIRQILIKCKMTEANESEFVLVEELIRKSAPPGAARDVRKSALNASPAPADMNARVLAHNENVWKAQSARRAPARFVLENRKETVNTTLQQVSNLLRALEHAHIKAEQSLPFA